MNKFLIFVSIGFALIMSTGATLAMPLVSDRTQNRSVILTTLFDGCWLGWHRSLGGECVRDQYGLLGTGIDFVPGPYYRTAPKICGGRGMYRVCNMFGYCWWVCA